MRNPRAFQSARRRAVHGAICVAVQRGAAVDHPSHAVDHASNHLVAHGHLRFTGPGRHAVASSHAERVLQRHHDGIVVAEADHLGLDAGAVLPFHPAHRSDRRGQARDGDGQTGHVHHSSHERRGDHAADGLNLLGERVHAFSGPSWAVSSTVLSADCVSRTPSSAAIRSS